VSLGQALLAPTTIYNRPLLALQQEVKISAMAHITGGGILENLPRVLPQGMGASIRRDSWDLPAVFQWLQSGGNITDQEMMRTFNCGVGMIIVLPAPEATKALAVLASHGITGWELGAIDDSDAGLKIH
jgi:phosphoribosylformylglycinamidine cyclo-ligase